MPLLLDPDKMSTPPYDLIVAAKIGLGHEPTGVVAVSRVETLTGEFDRRSGRWSSTVRYEAPMIERSPGGTSQEAIADLIADLAGIEADRVSVVVDVSSCGAPFLRALRERQIRSAAVMVGDAAQPRAADRIWQAPARELLSITMSLMTDQRIEVADTPHAAKLAEQLEAYRTKPAPRDALADWRPAASTELAVALMLGCWWSERMLRSIVRQPPSPRVPVAPPRPPTFDELAERAGR